MTIIYIYDTLPTISECYILMKCKCCKRHNKKIKDQSEIVTNGWKHIVNFINPNKKCACTCRHIIRWTFPNY